jgi:hypothetical protein
VALASSITSTACSPAAEKSGACAKLSARRAAVRVVAGQVHDGRHQEGAAQLLRAGLRPSWSYWIPLALTDIRTAPGSTATHGPRLVGLALAAVTLGRLVGGMARAGLLVVETYRTITVPMIVGGFGLSICAGAC